MWCRLPACNASMGRQDARPTFLRRPLFMQKSVIVNGHTNACLDPVADVWGIEEAEGGGGEAAVPGGVAAAEGFPSSHRSVRRTADDGSSNAPRSFSPA